MQDRVRDWLGAQTWPDVRPSDGWDGPRYWHPYGFVVLRLAVVVVDGWSCRLHLWPNGETQERLNIPTAIDQEIHCHGWNLASRTLVGEVSHSEYEVAAAAADPMSLRAYSVTSAYAVGRSILTGTGDYFTVTAEHRLVSTVTDGPIEIRAGRFHSTHARTSSSEWAATLVLTEDVDREKSLVLCRGRPDSVDNPRGEVTNISTALQVLDDDYRRSAGRDDRWVSSVFIRSRGAIYLVRNNRFPWLWQPIGGQAVASDGNPLETAVRETREEAGIDLEVGRLLPLGELPRDKGEGNVHAWLADFGGDRPAIRTQPGEILEGAWMGPEDWASVKTFGATRQFLRRLVDA